MSNENQDKIKEEIMRDLGFDKLTQEKQDEILAKIGEIILKKIFIATIDKLSPEDGENFRKMLKRGEGVESIEEFLGAKIPDYDMIIEKIVEEVKEDIKNN